MTALEIRLIGYALVFLAIVGSAFYLGHHVASIHYETLIAADKAAQTQALLAAQQRVIAAQNAQEAAQTAAESEHEQRTQADAASRSTLLDGMRGLETAVRSRIVSAAVANPGTVPAAKSSSADATAIAGLVDRVNASLSAFTAACQSIDNDRTAIISLQPVK